MALSSIDTNILVYAFQPGAKQARALAVLGARPLASVQILNEYVHTSRRKFGRPWDEIAKDLDLVRESVGGIVPVTDRSNREALRIARRYQLSFYDSLLLATALENEIDRIYSEDMQHDLMIDETLRIVDPFR